MFLLISSYLQLIKNISITNELITQQKIKNYSQKIMYKKKFE